MSDADMFVGDVEKANPSLSRGRLMCVLKVMREDLVHLAGDTRSCGKYQTSK